MDREERIARRLARNKLKAKRVNDPNSILHYHRRAVDRSDLEALRSAIYMTRKSGDEGIFNDAIIIGNLEIIELLYKSECPRYSDAFCFTRAINRGHVELVQAFRSWGFQWNGSASRCVSLSGNIHLVKMIYEMGIDIDDYLFANVVSTRNMECITFLLERISYGSNTLTEVCRLEDMELLRLFHKEGKYIPSDEDDYEDPYAGAKDLQTVKYLHEEMAIPWHEYSFDSHLHNEHLDILQYLIDSGCTTYIEDIYGLLDMDVSIIKFLHERDVNIDDDIDLAEVRHSEIDSARYYHDNIYRKECDEECKYCHLALEEKKELLWNLWELEIYDDYQSFAQWLPREMIEDTLFLVSVR
jgi:hypothetical protein